MCRQEGSKLREKELPVKIEQTISHGTVLLSFNREGAKERVGMG